MHEQHIAFIGPQSPQSLGQRRGHRRGVHATFHVVVHLISRIPGCDARECGELPTLRPRVMANEIRGDAKQPRKRVLAGEALPAIESTRERFGCELFGAGATDASAEIAVDRVDVPIEDLPESLRIHSGGGDYLAVGRASRGSFEDVHT